MKKNQTQTKSAAKPDVEVLEQAQRRQFSASYKLKIVQEADRLSGTGEIGAMLRREGLYSSHLPPGVSFVMRVRWPGCRR